MGSEHGGAAFERIPAEGVEPWGQVSLAHSHGARYYSPMSDDRDPASHRLNISIMAETWLRRLQPEETTPYDSLIVVGGPASLIGLRIPIDPASRVIELIAGESGGERLPRDPIRLPAESLEGVRARLEVRSDGWHVKAVDQPSRIYAGTVKVDDHRLVYGDELRMGQLVLVFVPAALEHLGTNVLDWTTGLLKAQVFLGEIAQMGDHRAAEGEPDFGLMLIRLEGLRHQFLVQGLDATPLRLQAKDGSEPKAPEQFSLPRFVRSFLGELPAGVPVARLESNLLAVAWKAVTPQALYEQARIIGRALLEAGLPLELGMPTFVLAPRNGRALTGLQVLTCAISSLDALLDGQRHHIIEADMETGGALHSEESLLDQLVASGRRADLIVATLQDEDYLRHQIGNQRLDSLRWNLRRAARVVAATAPGVAGILDERIVVLERGSALNLAERLREEFLRLTPDRRPQTEEQSEQGIHALQIASLSTTTQPRERDVLRRRIIAAVDSPGECFAPGHRESVERLPTPIAAPYSLIWVVSSEMARLKTVLDAFDGLIRFVTLSALASASMIENHRPTIREALKKVPPQKLPLGEWLSLLREIAPLLGESGDPIASTLRRVLGVTRKGVQFVKTADEKLLPYRNYFAHTMAPPEPKAAQVAETLIHPLNRLIKSLEPLRELFLISVIKKEDLRNSTRVWCRILTGVRENFEVRVFSWRGDPKALLNGSCYLALGDFSAVQEIHPLVKLHLCPQCDREEVFLTSGIPRPGREVELVAVTTGHRVKWELSESNDYPENLLDIVS